MERIEIRQMYKAMDSLNNNSYQVFGWVKSVRSNGRFGFIDMSDGTCFKGLQVVFDNNLSNFDTVEKLNSGSSIEVRGVVVLTPGAKQPFEMHAESVIIIQATDDTYPLQKKGHTMEYLRDVAYLRPRTNTFQAVFRIRSVAALAIHSYFEKNGYVYVNTPIITGADCEGSDQMFKLTTLDLNNIPKDKNGAVDYSQDLFGKPVYITGSGQLQGEAFALAFSKIYTFGPTLRTENSNTKIHANEFWMIEPEIAFCDINGLMDIMEDVMKYVINYVMERCPDELNFCDKFIYPGLLNRLNKVKDAKFTRINHHDVVDILKKSGISWQFEPDYKGDLAKEHEKYITECFKGPVFVTNWPKDIKAYYMKVNDDNETVAGVDLLLPEVGEIMGASEREVRYDVLLSRMKEMGVNPEPIDWYMNLRKFGGCPHSGFGIGFERVVMYLTGIENIRDVLPFPRTPNNCMF